MNKFALISVSDKTGIIEFANIIAKAGFEIIATGGTAKALSDAGIKIIPIQEITDNPESFDGRMKTISFQIESGILFDRKNPEHIRQAQELNIKPIDLVVCNLYPFEKSPSVENIDVGGPTMVRSAAKNFSNVIVVVDPKDYDNLAESIKNNDINLETRQNLAAKAFRHLSFYDSQIAKFLGSEIFPEEITIAGRKALDLRYGENPHQKAAIYLTPQTLSPFSNLKRLAGRELGLINITDINAGLISVQLFKDPAAVVIKHNNPCGIALGANAAEALSRAIDADSESAFGGVIVMNVPMDHEAANIVAAFKDEQHSNIDIIAAPAIDQDTAKFLTSVRKTTGLYTFGEIPAMNPDELNLKWIWGGFILQTPDNDIETGFADWKIVTKRKPTDLELAQMKIAWKFISRIKSNAIIVVDKELPMTRGIGTGQTSRVRAVKIALEQAGEHCKGGILASDSFFPFDDSVKLAAKVGIKTIVQQGGSVKDELSIKAADEAGISMVFTSRRAFWH